MATYYLTRRAAVHLRDIYSYTLDQWGETQGDLYMKQLIDRLQELATKPGSRKLAPHPDYRMAAAGKHFAIYKPVTDGIIVVSVLHNKRDIEGIMAQIGPALAAEIAQIEQEY